MAFRFFKVLLVALLALAVAMPFLKEKFDSSTSFEWVSVQGLSMVIIGLSFFVLVRLFKNISRYYDPNDLYEAIDVKLKNRADSLRQQLKNLAELESTTSKILRASLFSQYWISDYDKKSRVYLITFDKCFIPLH